MEGHLEILGRKFKEIMSKLAGNIIFQSGSTGCNSQSLNLPSKMLIEGEPLVPQSNLYLA